MNKIIRQKRIRSMLDSKFLLVILLLVVFVFAKAAYTMNKQRGETKNMVKSAENEYENLNKRYTETVTELDYMNSKTGKEREIREKFDLGREGERAIFIIDEKEATTTEEKKGGFGNILTKIKDFFGMSR